MRKSLRGRVGNVLDCNIGVSKFELKLLCNVHFRVNALGLCINLLFPRYGLKSPNTVHLEKWLE